MSVAHAPVLHCNGRQVASKFSKSSWRITDIEAQLARLTNSPAEDLTVYKFIHREPTLLFQPQESVQTKGVAHDAGKAVAKKVQCHEAAGHYENDDVGEQ